MVYKHILPIIACSLACATESFESAPVGEPGELSTMYGSLSGDALISTGAARSGKHFLQIKGAKNRCVKLSFTNPLTDVALLSFWVQRWTAKGAFHLQVIAETPGGNVVVQNNITAVVKEYKQAQAVLPAGTTGVKLICSSIEGGGALLDDMELFVGHMQVDVASCEDAGPQPMLKRAPINPVFSYKLQTKGAANPLAVQAVKLKIHPANAVSAVTIRSGQPDRSVDGTVGLKFRNGKTGKVYGTAIPMEDGTVTVPCDVTLAPGETELWVDATPAAHVPVGSKITFEPGGIVVGGKLYAEQAPVITRRVGYLLAVPDATVTTLVEGERPCVTYRIPGMIRTAKGTLLACFDARYENHLDLTADIDVAVVRSEDGGQTWSEPYVAMDAGPGKANGCGDPCILQDTATGRIWLQALATHFDRNPCILRSRSGYELEDTGQWEMVYSDDDGKTWSSNINITRDIKQEQWTTILAGPGCGICTSAGVLVFPAQIWDLKANPVSMSTICYSEDGGKTWHYGNGVPHRTSECQVIELADGRLMLTCRNETFQGKRVIYTTSDLGKTWQPHETNINTLKDPACQASLVVINSKKYGRVLLYSHPDSAPKLRNHMTVHASTDDGLTWNKGLVYDVRECWGYSCIAPIDDEHIGIIYEPAHVSETNDYHGMGFLRIPLSEILNPAP